MQTQPLFNKIVFTVLLFLSILSLSAQSSDGWYKVFTGKIGNYTATLHLHKTAKSYNGYLWFTQNQWPMPLYYNEPQKKSDSLVLSANSGPMAIVLSGIFLDDKIIGVSELSKDGNTPKKAGFNLQLSTETSFTAFGYFYADGSAKLPPALKNESECSFKSSTIWPENSVPNSLVFKNEIKQLLAIKTPVTDIGKSLNDEKNKMLLAWKKDNGKLTPKDAADMGLSLSVEQEDRVLVMYENEKYITLAHYSFSYSGGAHGNFVTKLSSFNKKTGKKLKLADIITSAGIAYFPRILEQVARLQYGVKNSTPLDQNGFLVNKISPTENFYVTDSGIGFLYAPYEIKSFADGEVNLMVPFAAIKTYLQPGIGVK
ncbi:hypothetical protein BH11BAC3_BH11BAC3_15540 [soil metagenome]